VIGHLAIDLKPARDVSGEVRAGGAENADIGVIDPMRLRFASPLPITFSALDARMAELEDGRASAAISPSAALI
jgi:hypothetical protein